MKSNQVVLVFSVIFLIVHVEAWLGLEKANRTLVKANGTEWHCYERLHNIGPLANNSMVRIKEMCALAICQPNRDIIYKGCPLVKIYNIHQKICRAHDGDLSKDYPDCCYQIKCDGKNSWERQ